MSIDLNTLPVAANFKTLRVITPGDELSPHFVPIVLVPGANGVPAWHQVETVDEVPPVPEA